MNLFVNANDTDLLYEKVFLHPYYRHVLLFYSKHAATKSFTLVFKNQICEKLKNEIERDVWLRDIEINFLTSEKTSNGIPLLSAPYSGNVFFLLRHKKDFKEYRKKIASWIRSQALTPVAKHVNKRLSLPLSTLLAKTNVSPNQITIFAFLWSILGIFCLLHPLYFPMAFACFQINSLLDGVDGEVAKMNFRFSAFGKKLDVYCDYLTSLLLMLGAFVGNAARNPKFEIVIGSVLGTVILTAIGGLWFIVAKKGSTPENFADVEGMCHKRLKQPKAFSEFVLSALLHISHRDFYILTVFILSLFGCFAFIHFFLVLVCVSWLVLSMYTIRIMTTHSSSRNPDTSSAAVK